MCTEKQKRCIYALAKKAGQKVDKDKLNEMTLEQASKWIDELREIEPMKAEKTDSEYNPIRLGLAVKLVFAKFNIEDVLTKSEISDKVVRMYDLLNAIELAIKKRA